MRGLQKFVLEDELTLNNDQAFARQNSESYYITCWQIFEGETLHMWGRYGKGVVVFAHFEALRKQLSPLLDEILQEP